MPTLLALALALGAASGSNLDAALETVDAHEIRADVFFFASDEMRGRDTPSPELRVAARFLRARLERLGFQPGAGTSFFHEYRVDQRRIEVERSRLAFSGPGGEKELVFGRDYFVDSTRDIVELEAAGDVVFGGKGEKQDFEAFDATGRWVLCWESEVSENRRARYAKADGALGLIIAPDPAGETDPFPAKKRTSTQLALHGFVTFVQDPSAKPADPVFPQALLSREGTAALLGAGGKPAGEPIAVGAPLGVRAVEERRGAGPLAIENVCGLWPGSDLANEVIIVSAHYDHVGVDDKGQIYRGADDNASGSMGLLAVADALAAYGPMRRSVLLMWVSGEEKGLWGSAAWTRAPTLPAGMKPVCDINIDMIGRNAPDYLLITPTRAHEAYNGLTKLAESLAPLEGFAELGSADEYWRRSDHKSFADNLKIPVAFLFSDVHDDYHQPTDTPDKIDYDKIRRVSRLVVRMLDGLQADQLTF